ncbi:hypothetical protein MGYG_00593 [Nannizzia gypsea CBS 118893]|uniref:Calcofluor white hypersensitive protein n=1 Tax=Arthroderma gypseum (strain ATCC MYA-4604 / CBS 118893) TaxID=535722 RepID=E5R0P6_ARTGP|nr:hypothetical protein MGYG_00593 [Nannizzia gypsea CBS 118893]EFQ97552.1 hypothetical protein MGYG_00593 [Nannizzia gypsea CBS 118893]
MERPPNVPNVPKSRMPLWLGLAALGAGGYYLYSAGGDPKKATRKLESDASRALHGGKPTGSTSAERTAAQAGAKLDDAYDNVRDTAKKFDEGAVERAKQGMDKIDKATHETAKGLSSKIEAFDKSVEEKAAEAKSGLSSWLGGSKK